MMSETERLKQRIEELESVIRRCARAVNSGDQASRTDVEEEVLRALAQVREEEGQASGNWRQIQRESPPERVKLLVVYQSGYDDTSTKVTVARTLDGVRFDLATDTPGVARPNAGDGDLNVVTHWRPLPDAPEGVDDGHEHWP